MPFKVFSRPKKTVGKTKENNHRNTLKKSWTRTKTAPGNLVSILDIHIEAKNYFKIGSELFQTSAILQDFTL